MIWVDRNPLVFHEWYLRSIKQSAYRHLSKDLKGTVNEKLPQPITENNGHFCTAMMLHHPMEWSNWVKIPCVMEIDSAGFICEKPTFADVSNKSSVLQYVNEVKKEYEKLNKSQYRICPDRWLFYKDKCIMPVLIYETAETILSNNVCKKFGADFVEIKNEDLNHFYKFLVDIMQTENMIIYFRRMTYSYISNNEYGIRSPNNSFQQNQLASVSDYYTLPKYAICEKELIDINTNSDVLNNKLAQNNLFWCGKDDNYWISVDYVCDGFIDCLYSRKDELEEWCQLNWGEVGSSEPQLHYMIRIFDGRNRNVTTWNWYCSFDRLNKDVCTHPNCDPQHEWQCKSGQCILKKLRCNRVFDCFDKSDEFDCKICAGFECFSSKKCIPKEFVYDDIVDCPGFEMEDEMSEAAKLAAGTVVNSNTNDSNNLLLVNCGKLSNKLFYRNEVCIFKPSERSSFDRNVCPLMEHLRHCKSYQCPSMFRCPLSNYCIEQHQVCDGKIDCVVDRHGYLVSSQSLNMSSGNDMLVSSADEMPNKCLNKNLSCPGRFRCRSFKQQLLCVEGWRLCDGKSNCLNGEDERYCTSKLCDKSVCKCHGYIVRCRNVVSSKSITDGLPDNLKSLSIHNSPLLFIPNFVNLSSFSYLGYLNVSSNNILNLTPTSQLFHGLPNLLILDLSQNLIRVIPSFTFQSLFRLHTLILTGNPIHTIERFAFDGLASILSLNLAYLQLKKIYQNTFAGKFTKLHTVNLTGNDIKVIEGTSFSGITNLSVLDIRLKSLDVILEEHPIQHMTIHTIETNILKICCAVHYYHHCDAYSELMSSCEDLLPNFTVQVLIWITGIIGLIGNVGVIVWRIVKRKIKSDECIMIMNLALADVLMSIYLLIIGAADISYRNSYVDNSYKWKSSLSCSLAGCVATISTQISISLLGFISLGRTLTIVNNFYRRSFRISSILNRLPKLLKYSPIPLWSIWICAAILYDSSRRSSDLYLSSTDGLCLPILFVTNQRNGSPQYAFSLFMLLYIIFFLCIIFCGYLLILYVSQRSRKTSGREYMLTDYKSARKMLILILFCFCCWLPIIILSFKSSIQISTKNQSSQALIVLVVLMAINSSANPYLYTFANVHLFFCGKLKKKQKICVSKIALSSNTSKSYL